MQMVNLTCDDLLLMFTNADKGQAIVAVTMNLTSARLYAVDKAETKYNHALFQHLVYPGLC